MNNGQESMNQRTAGMVEHWIIRVPEAEGPLRLQA